MVSSLIQAHDPPLHAVCEYAVPLGAVLTTARVRENDRVEIHVKQDV